MKNLHVLDPGGEYLKLYKNEFKKHGSLAYTYNALCEYNTPWQRVKKMGIGYYKFTEYKD